MSRWTFVLILLAGCSESLPPASAVTDFRAVAARVDVVGEPDRANPSPEEQVDVSILAIDQGAPPAPPSLTPGLLQWELVACVPLPTTIGPPICLDPIEPCVGCVETPPENPLGLPEMMRFQVPSEAELEEADATSVVFQGALCSNGQPSQDSILRFVRGESEDLSPCEGPATIENRPIEGRFVTLRIPIETTPNDPNLNPEVLNVLLDGRAWPPPYDQGVPRMAPRSGCAVELDDLSQEDKDAHPRAGDMPSTVDLSVTQQSLQTYSVDGQERIEEIQVSWLGDGGAFENSFSFITDPARSVLIQWRPPESAPEDGQLVRLNFVIRDGRGGTDWVERGLCVLPPTQP